MGDSTGPNSFGLRLARLLEGSTYSQLDIDRAVQDWERSTRFFKEISKTDLPKLSAESLEATRSGFPASTSDRLVMEVSLPLPLTLSTELYYIWHGDTIPAFIMVLMPFDEWQQETGADQSLLQHSFTNTGRPPLFWRTKYKLVPEWCA